MRPMTSKFDSIYKTLCQDITLGEQKIIFGTIGISNILEKYTKADAINMARSYIERRDQDNG